MKLANLSPEQKERIVAKLLSTPQGKLKLAASMQNPLRERLDYEGVFRRAAVVDPLPQGALPYYDKDVDVPAVVIGEEGQTPEVIVKGKRIFIPLFELGSNPKIPFTQVKERRYNLIDRAQDKAKQEIQAAEDTLGFSALDVALTAVNPATGVLFNAPIAVAGSLDRDSLSDAYAEVEKHDLRVARLFMNARDYSDIRKFGRDQIDPVTQKSLLNTGLMAMLWGAEIIVSRVVEVGSVYICTDEKFLAIMPQRIDITVLPADNPDARLVGWSIFEQIGIGVHNPRGVAQISITR
jgi:HK97 family phage major capsid protein